ncbi:MAG: M20/M25/M40 family metallo-hydrolase [Gammaproteobacteria bacterium]|nr:M20/M25/M40 family metallo-hydrolase [Gammaproteobacteria bacterium]
MTDAQQQLKQAYPDIEKKWDEDIIPRLIEYIAIPCKSPMFDPEWKKNGYIDQAMALITTWCEQQPIEGMQMTLLEEEGRTPLLMLDIAGQKDETILLYGHMDKQPEMKGWDEDKGPWKPVLQDGKLYGRGGADDGYAVFATLTAIATLQQLKIPHARCVVVIEASEESGSCDLPYYLTKHKDKIGNPNLVICLDSSCANFDQMWGTTSLRGVIGGTLSIEVLRKGLHSGHGSGVVPSTFDILRQLLDRVWNAEKAEVLIDSLKADIPDQRKQQAKHAADIIGERFYKGYTWQDNTQPISNDVTQLILNRTWRAALSVVGADGLPEIANAGNVTLPKISVKLSMRTPPTTDAEQASEDLQQALTENPPYGAKITYTPDHSGSGWHSPELSEWLIKANDQASQLFFDKPAAYLGEGGSIPFMEMLGEIFPDAQFLITGVVGPNSNIHGPNESLTIEMGKKITGCIASVIASHFEK